MTSINTTTTTTTAFLLLCCLAVASAFAPTSTSFRPVPRVPATATSIITTTTITTTNQASSFRRTPSSTSTISLAFASSTNTLDSPTGTVSDEDALLAAQKLEVQEMRNEMVQKYVKAGKPREDAEVEVDKFLSDPERSEKYLDMRRYAKAQSDAMMGFESPLFIFGGFFLGLMGTVGLNYVSAYKQIYPNHDGPIPFL
mmetsp:Transcript_4358/g.6377  ORF Transcript_4358/g.6377 Transcript_4358/m.6377 type:complete len:199 (-) Transcript_4358:217-813(-)|eukprot:CAMPEP_0194084462 /NCGR_PEP_ID=MMETSP0149-20130528/13492_1 /TAXON_ID=122233 /ORGANISM="Chaetoceros debilis, Strain MM31A-1" /LENGTH=198 /DNA_ID=CAMNT_0038767125 /DNA_START=109 /DNA_END=705 /DNA_ORIENTATION=+